VSTAEPSPRRTPAWPARLALVVAVGAGGAGGAGGAAAAEAPTASVTASKTEVAVGQAFTVDVTVSGPDGAAYTFPPEPGSEQVDLRTWRPPAGASPAAPSPSAHRYEAAVFAVGEADIPAITIGYRLADGTEGQVSTKPLPIRVVSVLPKDPKEQKLADVRGPVALEDGPAFWVALALAIAVLAALVWWWRRRPCAAAPAAPSAPPVPPDVEALQALDRLASARLVERGDYRGFYIALTGVLKLYLERRLGAPVVEMTTAEMIAFLRDVPHHDELVPTMRDLAGAADQIKFARGEGLAQEAERHLAAARALVRSLEARFQAAEAEARAEAERAAGTKRGRERVA
jgi:hypothetical protein